MRRRALLGAVTVLAAFVWPGASNAATVTEYPLAAGAGPSRIVVGPDARLWFTDASSSNVGVIGLDGTLGGSFSVAASATPTGMVRGPDGNLWFVEKTNNAVGRITPTGTVTEFSLAALQANSGPLEIALGPSGLLYFTEANVDRIASINPLAGSDAMILASLTESAIVPSGNGAGAAGLTGITPGPDGRLWFTEATADRVGDVTANLATINEYSTGISAGSAPTGIAVGPDGALWFTENSGSRIGRIPTAGFPVSQFSLPTAGRGRPRSRRGRTPRCGSARTAPIRSGVSTLCRMQWSSTRSRNAAAHGASSPVPTAQCGSRSLAVTASGACR